MIEKILSRFNRIMAIKLEIPAAAEYKKIAPPPKNIEVRAILKLKIINAIFESKIYKLVTVIRFDNPIFAPGGRIGNETADSRMNNEIDIDVKTEINAIFLFLLTFCEEDML